MSYCPFACAGSRYMELYRDTGLGRLAWVQPGGHNTARTRPRHGSQQRCDTVERAPQYDAVGARQGLGSR